MWQVYSDKHLIYDSRLENLNIFNTKLELEINKVGAFTFTIYPSNPYYSNLEKLKSIIRVYRDDYLIFKGRILNDDKLFHNEKQVTCEGTLAYLLDSIQRPYDFQSGENHTNIDEFFKYLIDKHNSQVGAEKQFRIGEITVTDPNNYIVRSDTTYMNTWDSINKKLIETNGGYLRVRYEIEQDEAGNDVEVNYLDYLEDFDELANQPVEFGVNLLDFCKTTKGEEIATAIIPLGVEQADGTRLTIESVTEGNVDYVYNQEAVDKYGWIFKVVEYEDVTEASNLKTKAEADLAESINLSISIELTAADLAGLKKEFNSFRLGTYVSFKSKPHDEDSKFLVNKLSIELLKPANNKLTLGKSYSTFTEKTSSSNATQKEIINAIKGIETQTVTTQQVSSMVTQSAEEIYTKVSDEYYAKGETEELVSSVSTELEQTKSAFEMRFTEIEQEAESHYQEQIKYIRFVDGNIVLGEVGNEITLRIENDRISFLQDNAEVAYFSNRKLYVTEGEYITSLKLGKFAFIPRSNGSLDFKKVE